MRVQYKITKTSKEIFPETPLFHLVSTKFKIAFGTQKACKLVWV